MKLLFLCIVTVLCYSQADKIGPPSSSPSGTTKPFGPYYCQARCLASCLETFLAPTVDECQKFCPPFQDNLPCPTDDSKCWLTCGVPESPNDQPAPDSVILTPLVPQNDNRLEPNPFVIELGWNFSPNASLYIVEFYPHNRSPKPGESNFFQVMTTSLTYSVRKEDECVEYSARVIAVNSFGISVPTYAFIGAPVPNLNSNDHFSVRNIQRDPWSADLVTVTIDYTFPNGWPVDDIDIDSIVVTAADCQGPLGSSFDSLATPNGVLQPSYDAIIGKDPVTAIQLSFNKDVVQSNCLFQMRISALVTRCNTSLTFDQTVPSGPGIDFRLNCDNVEGACADNATDPVEPPPVLAPIPVPAAIAVDPEVVVQPLLNTPGHIPPGVDRPEDPTVSDNLTVSSDTDDMPTPPALPLFIIGDSQQPVNAPVQSVPPGSVNVIDISPNGSSFETMAVIPQTMFPLLCELDMLDVDPSVNDQAQSLINLKVQWLERQPLPPPPPPTYFTIRYGPIIRKLVDDGREPLEIIPGYETIVRTGQQQTEMPFLPDPTREITISNVQRNSLLKLQICAVFDPNSEPLIQWDMVPGRRIDLAALEPFLELENSVSPPQPTDMSPLDVIDDIVAGSTDINSVSPVLPSAKTSQQTDEDTIVDVPLVIAVEVEPKPSPDTYWMKAAACVLLTVLTVMLLLIFLSRVCRSRRQTRKIHMHEKPTYIVSTLPAPPPAMNEVVKVPLP